MNEHLNRKLKLQPERVPFSLDRFGNTSSVSIPLTMVTELGSKLDGRKKLLFSGFGVGLSLGSAVLELNDPYISKLVEV
jgi:3-oxoacyl-[acyl-carrier-protein] synthase-3